MFTIASPPAAIKTEGEYEKAESTPENTLVRLLRSGDSKFSTRIEIIKLNPAVSPLLLFASLPDCSQNQTAVSGTQHLFYDF